MVKKLLSGAALLALISGCTVTPQPFTAVEIDQQVKNRMYEIRSGLTPVQRDISLYEAMARAIKFNLDYKVAMMEEALRAKELNSASWDMLPKLVAEAGYSARNNYSGASSSELLGSKEVGEESLVASTSSDRDIYTTDLELSWDILDFGLSYVRARQGADRYLIANERKRKIVNRILEDVRTAYWRAVSAQRLITELRALEQEVNEVLDSSNEAYKQRKTTPLSALTYQRELLNIKEQIQKIDADLVIAKQQLATLMNLSPGERFSLVVPRRNDGGELIMSAEDMVDMALHKRPELREAAYNERINKYEATALLLNLLPNLRIYGGVNYDTNDYLYNNDWQAWGAQVSWNLIQAFSYPTRKQAIGAQQELLREQSLATTMAIISEVHISRIRYQHACRKLNTSRRIYNVQGKILELMKAGFQTKRIGRQVYIREKMNLLLRNAKYDLAYAEMQNAMGNIYASMGEDSYNRNIIGTESVDMLSVKLQRHWEALNRNLSRSI